MMHRFVKNWARVLPIALLVLVANPALAHHAMDGKLPTEWWQGLLSGLAHPVIGLDHLLFVVAIALVSIQRSRGLWIPAFFVVAALLGTGLHLQQVNLPLSESVIALSVLAIGFILAVGKQLNFAILAGLAAIAGIFHGYAYGESIVGAGMAPLVWYLIGFTAIQYAIAVAINRLGTLASNGLLHFSRLFCGTGICAVGGFLLATSLTQP